MNKVNRWLLPEGIEEILPPRAIELEQLCRELVDLLSGWGYEFVLPPMIEYLESLLIGTGEDLDLQTFKLTDQLSGRLMGVRADITPQVARIDSHLLKKDIPTRLCYLGNILHTRPSKSGETRAPLQLGAELYGHAGIASDIEIVQLMLEALVVAGIDQPYLDIGHVVVFQSLCEKSGMDKTQQAVVFDILQRKAKDELKHQLRDYRIDSSINDALCDLVDMNGDDTLLNEAKSRLSSISVQISTAIDEIASLVIALQDEMDIAIHIDLAELRGYHYHTGMIYTAFVRGKGEGIAYGGRYDDIGQSFGRARPATGFSTDVRSLMKYRKKTATIKDKVFAPLNDDPKLEQKIRSLRASGKIVIRQLQDQTATATQMDCSHTLQLSDGNWTLTELNDN